MRFKINTLYFCCKSSTFNLHLFYTLICDCYNSINLTVPCVAISRPIKVNGNNKKTLLVCKSKLNFEAFSFVELYVKLERRVECVHYSASFPFLTVQFVLGKSMNT